MDWRHVQLGDADRPVDAHRDLHHGPLRVGAPGRLADGQGAHVQDRQGRFRSLRRRARDRSFLGHPRMIDPLDFDPPDYGLRPTAARLLSVWREQWRLTARAFVYALTYSLAVAGHPDPRRAHDRRVGPARRPAAPTARSPGELSRRGRTTCLWSRRATTSSTPMILKGYGPSRKRSATRPR